jgi:uncharacterized 2Fe-2S/4Fe-4S cluster protein (DUF4445 family)
VRFSPSGAVVVVEPGVTFEAAAAIAGVSIDAPCAGLGRCGGCRVKVVGSVAPPTEDERAVLGDTEIGRGTRLACRARVLGDAEVTVSAAGEGLRVSGSGSPSSAVTTGDIGVAIDLGTTTVVASVVDLATGERLASSGGLNPQVALGADVMSRVAAALAGQAERLRTLAVGVIHETSREALRSAGRAEADVRRVTLVGNTAMTNLLLGLDVSPLAAAPYEGAETGMVVVNAPVLGLVDQSHVEVRVCPGASAFIGSDVLAGLVATGVHDTECPVLYIDLGTNGEIVLASEDRLVAASAAAGPAFEGAGLAHGMRAEPGAIERVWLTDGAVAFSTVADVPAAGICGSGALDAVAALLDLGVIDASGRMHAVGTGPLAGRVLPQEDGSLEFTLLGPVTLTQHDVRHVQLAKGAVRTAVDVVLAEAGVLADDVAEVVIAGGFGHHVRADVLARLGILPDGLAARIRFVGNAALKGAELALHFEDACRVAFVLSERVEVVDLAGRADFQQRFVSALGFPSL